MGQQFRENAEDRVLELADIRVMFYTIDRTKQAGVQDGQVVDRSTNYIHSSLASMWMCDPRCHEVAGVDLVVGNEHHNYLTDFYKATAKVTIHQAPHGLVSDFLKPPDRLHRNYVRTLELAMKSEEKGFLICEDDIIFMDGFWRYALDAINEMRCTELPQVGNFLSFYSINNFVGDGPVYRGRYFCSYAGGFCGLCCIYYDREAIPALHSYLEEHFKEQPADLLFGEYTNISWTRYATPTGLVQHVGGTSAGTSEGRYWTDSRFNCGVACWDPGWIKTPYTSFKLNSN